MRIFCLAHIHYPFNCDLNFVSLECMYRVFFYLYKVTSILLVWNSPRQVSNSGWSCRRTCVHLLLQEHQNHNQLLNDYRQDTSLSVSHSVVPDSLRPHGLQPTRFLCPRGFPGRDTGVGCHFLLQGIFPGIEPRSPALQAGPFTDWATREGPVESTKKKRNPMSKDKEEAERRW